MNKNDTTTPTHEHRKNWKNAPGRALMKRKFLQMKNNPTTARANDA